MSEPRCESCGYTKRDSQIQGDHRLCKNAGNAPWERNKVAKPADPQKQCPSEYAGQRCGLDIGHPGHHFAERCIAKPADPAPPFSAQAVEDGYWEIYHDDDCDGIITPYPENLCLKCGMHPDLQSRGARRTNKVVDPAPVPKEPVAAPVDQQEGPIEGHDLPPNDGSRWEIYSDGEFICDLASYVTKLKSQWVRDAGRASLASSPQPAGKPFWSAPIGNIPATNSAASSPDSSQPQQFHPCIFPINPHERHKFECDQCGKSWEWIPRYGWQGLATASSQGVEFANWAIRHYGSMDYRGDSTEEIAVKFAKARSLELERKLDELRGVNEELLGALRRIAEDSHRTFCDIATGSSRVCNCGISEAESAIARAEEQG